MEISWSLSESGFSFNKAIRLSRASCSSWFYEVIFWVFSWVECQYLNITFRKKRLMSLNTSNSCILDFGEKDKPLLSKEMWCSLRGKCIRLMTDMSCDSKGENSEEESKVVPASISVDDFSISFGFPLVLFLFLFLFVLVSCVPPFGCWKIDSALCLLYLCVPLLSLKNPPSYLESPNRYPKIVNIGGWGGSSVSTSTSFTSSPLLSRIKDTVLFPIC